MTKPAIATTDRPPRSAAMPTATIPKPITPAKVASLLKRYNQIHCNERRHQASRYRVADYNMLAPWCPNPAAYAAFVDTYKQMVDFSRLFNQINGNAYTIEPDPERARELRGHRLPYRIVNTPHHRVHYRNKSVQALWFEPPIGLDNSEVAETLQDMASALQYEAIVALVLDPPQVQACSQIVSELFEDAHFYRLTGRSEPLIAITGRYAPHHQQATTPYPIANIAGDGQLFDDGTPIPELLNTQYTITPTASVTEQYVIAPPLVSMPVAPRNLVRAAQHHGSWRNPKLKAVFDHQQSQQAIKPIERLPEGHSALIAANSMIDHLLIKDPTDQHNPVIIRGYFRKSSRETFRTPEIVKVADYYESNISAMDTVTGEITQVGDTAEGLQKFMSAYGSAIRHNIAQAYPPTVDTNSPEYARIGAVVDAVPRPLIGKQRHAAIAGAMHLKRNPHLNFFATQGSGKTCTTAAMAAGMGAAVVAAVVPSRVIPNWTQEIRAIHPNAIIRVVRNKNPIGTPVSEPPSMLDYTPPPFARSSLEEIRADMRYATPETPLWILLKKDTARTSYPVKMGLREVWSHDHAPTQPLHRPLAHLAEVEKRIGATPMPGSSPDAVAHPKRLYRNAAGQLQKLEQVENHYLNNSRFNPSQPTLVCPSCWEPVYNHPRQPDSLRQDDRRHHCPSFTNHAVFPAATRQWQAEQNHGDADVPQPPTRKCNFHFAQPMPDRYGNRLYSYGEYFTKRMVHKVDLLVIDESQDYKGGDTLQGRVIRNMAQKAKRTIALTGTPFGGRIGDFFYPLIAFNPQFTRDYNYHQLSKFTTDFGRREVTSTMHRQPHGHTYWKSANRSIPGFHPKLLTYFWDNTIFMDLDDVDVNGVLPSFTQHARLIEMDDHVQPQTGFSQRSAYHSLDDAISGAIRYAPAVQVSPQTGRTARQHNYHRITNYIHEMMTYPENAWLGAAPKDPQTGQVICEMPPLESDWLYPKESELLSIVERHRDLGRKCLVYCTHTKLRDVTARLKNILEQEGFKVLQLTSAVQQEQRAEWLREQADHNDVIICHPRLVETGVNLIEYPTIIWYEVDHSMITTEQASARSYRINQTQPVEVYFLAYAGTMQEHALHLIAQKSDVSRTFRGDLSKSGLSAFNPNDDDLREEIARALLKADYQNSHQLLDPAINMRALDRMFNETNIMAGEAYLRQQANPAPVSEPGPVVVAIKPQHRRNRQPTSPPPFVQPTLGI